MQGEAHRLDRAGWLRAAVLGANDGLVSTASLVVGVAAASPAPGAVLLAGMAGLTAGALSMAAGEFVSVSSQADLETAEIARETAELAATPEAELAELAAIYRARGLSAELAREVARELTAKDALGSHLRDELGITEVSTARPMQAALASAASSQRAACRRSCLRCLPRLASYWRRWAGRRCWAWLSWAHSPPGPAARRWGAA